MSINFKYNYRPGVGGGINQGMSKTACLNPQHGA